MFAVVNAHGFGDSQPILMPWLDFPPARQFFQWQPVRYVAVNFICDIAEKAVSRARAKVADAGYHNVRHVIADLNSDSSRASSTSSLLKVCFTTSKMW
jgi:hypothetical protein